MEFPCCIEGITNDYDGRKIFLHRSFDGAEKLFEKALQVLVKRPDRALPFLGCGLKIKTPIKEVEVILEDNFGCRMLMSSEGKVLAQESN